MSVACGSLVLMATAGRRSLLLKFGAVPAMAQTTLNSMLPAFILQAAQILVGVDAPSAG